ncbi:Osmotically-inducible protein Y [Aquicella siphonis]|uniref:Osmotically-inducible protein Y n=1 Tax=Aquicella siphonis TaxID=254247 RepID=A0A5E4PED1_9COXI|nr:BON domain-containing protein [Aquicella siphonis]VVC74932.1 Osmotically-inducible protein Y [Aquicella siphonis]
MNSNQNLRAKGGTILMRNKWISCCVLLAAVFGLQGCMNMATTGAQAVYNRHSIEKNLKDQYLTMQAYQGLYIKTKKFKNTNIAISTYNQEMLLAGQVPESWQKHEAEKIVKAIPDVGNVYNLIEVQSPSSTLTRISDTWITAKVKTKLIASNDLDASQIKVVTENGIVFLMGILPPDQANAAVEIASNTDGVLSVVKIFSYMKISKKLA